MIDLHIIQQAVHESRDGITIVDLRQKGRPVVFVNPAFESITGYTATEALGRNCRYLHENDYQQPEIAIIRNAIVAGEYCLVTLRNYRKDSSLFWNELSLSPIHADDGELTHYIGMQRDVTDRMILIQQLQKQKEDLEYHNQHLQILNNLDPLTGINNRRYFDSQLSIQWNIALRNRSPLSLFMVDIDYFKQFNDTYGHPAGDECLKAIAKTLSNCLRRVSDFVARYGGEEFVILISNINEKQAQKFAHQLRSAVQKLAIVHGKSTVAGHVSVSIGHCTLIPELGMKIRTFVQRADEALYQAKAAGRNQAITG
jgi:diguanylate cyclase (GGDEF)-like protein/PAS domain S-box-containing protein